MSEQLPDDDVPRAYALARLREALRTGHLPQPPTPLEAGEVNNEGEQSDAVRPESRDPLPEHTAYRDTGCHLFASCLCCPLVACIFETAQPRRRAQQHRNRRLQSLAARGWSTDRLARRFALSSSQVRRIRRRH